MKVKTPGEEMGFLSRLAVTVLIVLVIVLVTVFFAVRMRGGHTFIEDRVEKHLGMSLEIERMRIGWPYALVMENVESEDFETEDGPGFRAQEIRIGPSLRGPYRIAVRRGHLRMSRNKDGVWEPGYFSRLGDMTAGDLPAIGRAAGHAGKRIVLDVASGTIEWAGAGTTNVASAHGIDYRRTPVRVPGHRLDHHALSIYALALADGTRMTDLEREWLASETFPYVELVGRRIGE